MDRRVRGWMLAAKVLLGAAAAGALPPAAIAQTTVPPGGLRAPRSLADGMIVASPLWIAAEMIANQPATTRKYEGRALQLTGAITTSKVSGKLGLLSIVADVPGQGYWRFSCSTYDPASVQAISGMAVRQEVTVAGIYDPNPLAGASRQAVDSVADAARFGGSDMTHTMELRECVVLTGHPQAEQARALVAAAAAK